MHARSGSDRIDWAGGERPYYATLSSPWKKKAKGQEDQQKREREREQGTAQCTATACTAVVQFAAKAAKGMFRSICQMVNGKSFSITKVLVGV